MRLFHDEGFTFIEILVSIFILSFVLLGLSGVILYSLQHMQAAYDEAIAIHQMTSMAERLQALHDHQGLKEQVDAWNVQNKEMLPSGMGTVSGSYPTYQIQLSWGRAAHLCLTLAMGV